MTKTLHGKVHGSSIQLDEHPGLAEGQEVEVVVRPLVPPANWGEGIRRSAGAAADVPGWDDAMAEIENERKSSKFRELPE
jgi:hypothetical protein